MSGEASIPSDFIPRWLKVTALVWPVAIAITTATIAMARADSRLEATIEMVDDLKTEGSPAVRERLAGIETNQKNQERILERMEKKLDQLAERR